MQCPFCIVIARNTSISASVTSGRGEGPLSSWSRWSWYYLLVSTTSSVIIYTKYNRKTLSKLEPSLICSTSLSLFPLGSSVKVCTTLLWLTGGCVHCKGDGVWTCWPDLLWKTSSSSEALDENELLDAWPLDVGWSGWRCDTPGLSSKPPSSSEVLSLGGPCFVTFAVPDKFWYPVWGQKLGPLC